MIADVKGIAVTYKNMRTATVHIDIDKYCLSNFEYKNGDLLTVEISKKKKKRSLRMNSYMWALCDEIARAVGDTTAGEVYRRAIREVGKFADISVVGSKVEDVIKSWERTTGREVTGWQAIPTGEAVAMQGTDKNGEKTSERWYIVRLYYGSSVYTTEQMSHLLNWIVDEAQGLGIDTATPEERSLMLKAWEKEHAAI